MPGERQPSSRGGHLAAPRRSGAAGSAARWLAGALAALTCLAWYGSAGAASSQLTVQATVLSRSNCRFDTNSSTLNFGALDPANPLDVTTTTSVPFVCHGSAPVAAFAFSLDDGLYRAGPAALRMRNATDTSAFLPYSLTLSPASGTVLKNVQQNLTVGGTVRAADYQSARAGNYSDSVVLTILP
jgi:Spore Coat Protein U domain